MGRSKKQVQMVRHDHEFMQQIDVAVAILKESLYENFGRFAKLEDGSSLPAFCRDEIRATWGRPVLRC